MGTGRAGAWIEGEKAVNQPLNSPYGILLRANGSVLIADSYNSVLAEIGEDGRLRRFAGKFRSLAYQGMGSYTGDGGPAREATFNTPFQLSVDESGNVYVVDTFNNALQRISPDGIITTFAGGKFGVANTPDRLNHPTSALPIGDNLYIADTGNNAVWSVPLN